MLWFTLDSVFGCSRLRAEKAARLMGLRDWLALLDAISPEER